MRRIDADVCIVGTGASGLFAALHIPSDKRVVMLSKTTVEESDSFLAQGGICVLKDEKDFDSFFEDTLKAGHYENRKESVEIMIRSSRDIIDTLQNFGVRFEKDEQGKFQYTKEGCHSKARILYHEDVTGEEITSHLLKAVLERKNIEILEHTRMVDIVCDGGCCYGVVAKDEKEEPLSIASPFTILACGGIGGLFKNSTNYPHLTGDAIAVAIKHHIALEHPEYVQIHPTTLYSTKKGRRFLISESVRGEGAKLYGADGKRFANEVLPRDTLTRAIRAQMAKDNKPYVWLDMTVLKEEEILHHFPHIYQYCKEEGYDVTKDWIPVVPSQHYYMGGIHVDSVSKTSMDQLYAVGETSCNGVHGKNRLASNSLLESLVFAKRAALDLACRNAKTSENFDELALQAIKNECEIHYPEMVMAEIRQRGGNSMNSIAMSMNVDHLIKMAIEEDITSEDITTNAIMKGYQAGVVQLICKQDGIVAGLPIFERVFHLINPDTSVNFFYNDGDAVKAGDLIALVRGDVRVLLQGERTALNYLQRMSGIATYTHSIAELLKDSKTKLLDTRKTTPNMRVFEKYAVKVGGGYNHRFNLSDGILLKDNHIAAAGGIKQAVMMAKEYASFVRKIEVETENMDMVKEAVEAGADIIMLDNMGVEEMKEAVAYIDGRALTECSGNVTKENVASLLETGVDYISCGALTHSAPILDFSLKNLHIE